MNEVSPLGVAFIVLWAAFTLGNRLRDRLPLRARRWLGDVDLNDPTTIEEIKLAYVEGELSAAEMERRLAVAVDPRADELRRTAEKVSGIGPATAWNIAERFVDEDDLAAADLDELEDVPNVGPKRARAIRERLRE